MHNRVMLLRKKIHLEKFRYKVQVISIVQLCLGVATILFITARNSFFLYFALNASSGVTVFLMFLSTMNAICTVMCWGINAYIIEKLQKKLQNLDDRILRLSTQRVRKVDAFPCATVVGICSHSVKINFAAASFMCLSRLLSLTFLFMYKTHVTRSIVYGYSINPGMLLELLSCTLYVTSVVVGSATYFYGRRKRKEHTSFFSDKPVDYQLRKFTLLLLGMFVLSLELAVRVTDIFGVSSSPFPIANILAMLGLSIFATGNFYGLCVTEKKLSALTYELENESHKTYFYVEPIEKLITCTAR